MFLYNISYKLGWFGVNQCVFVLHVSPAVCVGVKLRHAAGEEEHRAPSPLPRGAPRGHWQRAGVCDEQHALCHHPSAQQPE